MNWNPNGESNISADLEPSCGTVRPGGLVARLTAACDIGRRLAVIGG